MGATVQVRGVAAMIRKVVLQNFKRFRSNVIEFTPGLNMLVGDNEAGKSTLLEAINLGLTKRVNGKFFDLEFSHHYITSSTVAEFVADVAAGNNPRPPEVLIEVYFEDEPSVAHLKGKNNSLLEDDACGYRVRAALDPDFTDEYRAFIDAPGDVKTVPTEYYRVDWMDFAGHPVNVRAVSVKASLIDASRIKLKSGTDYHLQKIITETLDTKQRAELARTYRRHQEQFGDEPAITAINSTLASNSDALTAKQFTMEIDTSGANGWESSLSPHLEHLPFHFSGSGEQNRLKILIALSRRATDSHVVLVEEPENHLSFPNLNDLVERIATESGDRQLIITTHSSYVVNKLGLEQLVLLGSDAPTRLTALPPGTQDYFKKLAGYDTLRLVLAKAAVLVEGPSDELIFQRAYHDRFGRRPIEDGVDVIAVRGLSATRFLDLAIPLNRRTIVLTDNDGDHIRKVDERYSTYSAHAFITVCRSDDDTCPTLEPQLLAANGLAVMNNVLGKTFADDQAFLGWAEDHKTDIALAFHDTKASATWPAYVEDAVNGLAG